VPHPNVVIRPDHAAAASAAGVAQLSQGHEPDHPVLERQPNPRRALPPLLPRCQRRPGRMVSIPDGTHRHLGHVAGESLPLRVYEFQIAAFNLTGEARLALTERQVAQRKLPGTR